jgi:2-methylcitrate dehydratase PrpD
MHETKILAEWIAGLRLEDVPETVKAHARRFLLDNFGCQIAGATVPWSRTYYDVITKTRSGTGATVAYYGDALAPDDAAFLNATFNHANETDDTHLKSPTHPGQIAVPTAMAAGEYGDANGEKLLLAVIAAYETMIRLSWSCSPHLIYRGHHPPVGVGPFGGAAAGSVIMGFDKEHALNALGIAGSHSAGLIEYTKTGGSVKRMHAGIPAQAGVRATMFANAGITGPESIIEGEKGFCKVFAVDYDLSRLTDGLGDTWHMLDNGLKPYSCCHLIHAALDALDEARGKQVFAPEDVVEINVATNSEPILSHIGSIIEPEDILGAQFSLPFSMAMRLYGASNGMPGGNGFWDYLKVDLGDETLRAAARKVKVVVAENQNNWARVDEGAGIEVKLTNGDVVTADVQFSKGLPENPFSDAEVDEKFHYLTDGLLPAGRTEEIIDAVANVESVAHVSDLAALLVAPDSSGNRAAAE